MNYLQKQIKKGYKLLKADTSAEITDNFHLLHGVYVGLVSSLKIKNVKKLPVDSGDGPRVFEYAAGYCKLTRNIIDKKGLDSFLDGLSKNIELSNDEISYVTDMFAAALFLSICRNVLRKNGSERILDAVKSLRFLKNYSCDDLYEKLSGCERLFQKDNVYRCLDKNSKNVYRYRLSLLAKKNKISESELLRIFFERAAAAKTNAEKTLHYYLFEEKRSSMYMPLTIILPFVASFITAFISENTWLFFLTLLPYYEILKEVVRFIYSKCVFPEPLLRVETKNGCAKTLTAQITLISDKQSVDNALNNLEITYFSNKTKNMLFGVLADLPASLHNITDEELETVAYLKKKTEQLNDKYGNVFFAAVRRRFPNAENRFSGRERKRGAVEDFLNATRKNESDAFLLLYGDIYGAEYFAALDSDTQPSPDSIRELVGVLMYPSYKPSLNESATAVSSGYAVASPRMEVMLPSARENFFSKIISGFGGVELYSNASFSIYQDLYGEGIFAGKGVIDIGCFLRLLAGTFPDNTVLSHDILEGSFLRTAYVSDVVFSDNTPKNLLSYCKRDHRWIRGDVQNVIFLKNKIKTKNGEMKNPLSAVSRYKLADNVLRALTLPSVLVLMLSSVFLGYFAFFAALFTLFVPAVLSLASKIAEGSLFLQVSYRSRTLSDFAYIFAQPLFNFLFLPYLSYIRIDAFCKAVVRLFTHKHLLEWTTAAEGDRKIRGTIAEYLQKMPVSAVGIVFIFMPWLLPVTILWLLGILLAYYSSKGEKKKEILCDTSKYASDMWQYFATFQNEENNFLPPDNFQQIPLGAQARRTSPTNIGLSLLCALGATDLKLLDESGLYTLLENALTTLENAEKYEGHLYNWYNTQTMKPLHPRYISSVDNGNFAAFMYALKNGLEGFESRRAKNLAERIERLLDKMDFSLLYDKQKNLFHIGLDVETMELSNSYYDLYASEARLLSFYAIAKRQVPLKNWQTLSRFPVRKNGKLGVKSWTGTMFEYFMPNLLLPVSEGSLGDEALRFAFAEQLKAAKNKLWGISESGFYAFDNGLSYQYKAFGVPATALKKSSFRGTVISPYSTWLTLPMFPKEALENLKRLEDAGLYGKYGFYEAYDMSVSPPSTVCSFMAHHVGMSFISIVNYACKNIMEKRFMSPEMLAFSSLLDEKLPTIVVNYKNETTGKHRKERYFGKSEEYSQINPDFPNVMTLSNKTLSAMFADSGVNSLSYENTDVFRRGDGKRPYGAFVVYKDNNKTLPLTYFPLEDTQSSYRVFFDEGEVMYYARKKDGEARLTSSLDAVQNCQVWDIMIKNNSSKAQNGRLLFYAEPVLCDSMSYRAHPAFAGLFIESSLDKNILYFHRRTRDGKSGLWLGIATNFMYEFELSRFNVLNRFDAEKSLEKAFEKPFSNDTRGPVDPCAALRTNCELAPKEIGEYKIYLAVGKTRDEVKKSLENTMSAGYAEVVRSLTLQNGALYQKHEIKKEDIYIFNLIRGAIIKQTNNLYRPKEYRNKSAVEELWKYGVSGDFPIVLIKVDELCVEKCESFVKAFFLLKAYHIECEAVFCFSEKSGYDRPVHNKLHDCLLQNSLGEYYEKRGGVFLVNIQSFDDFSLFASLSLFYADLSKGWRVRRPKKPYVKPLPILPSQPVKTEYVYKTGVGGFTKTGFAIDDKNAVLSRPPWTHVLANSTFGTVVSDSTLGFTYAFNSQKNPLTPWQNDAVADNRGEKLTLSVGKCTFDIIRGASAFFEKGKAVYKAVCQNVSVTVTVFVPLKMNIKIIDVAVENNGKDSAAVQYLPEIVMGNGLGTVNKTVVGNAIFYGNPLNSEFSSCVTVLFGNKIRVTTKGLVHYCDAGRQSRGCFMLGCERSQTRATALMKLFENPARCRREYEKLQKYYAQQPHITIKTENRELDLFYNNFLQNQIRATRLKARAAFYQNSGAYGFRDQLQDAASLATIEPSVLKHQILRACRRQFEQGDVMHWWHEGKRGFGVRTRSADDLLWLPYTVCEYIEKTGDFALLFRTVSYLTGDALAEGEDEKMMDVTASTLSESVYMHCVRAIEHGVKTGQNGLVLFGAGDWNDGMNRVGNKGSGESVWNTLFAIIILEKFAAIAEKNGDADFAKKCLSKAAIMRQSVENNCWDGLWYIRGIYDNGEKLGSKESDECKTDLLPQAFSSIAGGFDKERVMSGLVSADKALTDRKNRLVKLFTPPFENGKNDPGYIKGYISGVRENGGQYTHAAVWLALGFFKNGQYEKAAEILDIINPVTHSKTIEEVKKYRTEPYVIAADVYSNPAHEGMGGWSHYTGAAGWYFRTVTEELLGITRRGDRLYLQPKLPENMSGYSAHIQTENTKINLTVKKGIEDELFVDNAKSEYIPLDGREHKANYFSKYLLS